MELLILFSLFLAAILLLKWSRNRSRTAYTPRGTTSVDIPNLADKYTYDRKARVMTKTELEFFKLLSNALDSSMYIIPQAHLSSFLSHTIPGQSWRGAFAAINGKSVDFLVCEYATSRPLLVIEVDDYTHQFEDRIVRDTFVNTICKRAKVPVVRFGYDEWGTTSSITQKIRKALQ